MIQTHESNSRWWGQPVGIITDPAFFSANEAARNESLAPFAWVEFKAPLATAPSAFLLCATGFALTDVQMGFRIALSAVPESPSVADYDCRSAAEEPFTISADEVRTFTHERFLQLPGITDGMLNERYANWANDIIRTHPRWCLRLSHHGVTQGWFLSESSGGSLGLTLAMLSTQATVSGQHLYQRALREYAKAGATIGHASFSVRNTAVLNIYSHLGAKFTPPTGIWTWVRPT